MREINSHIISPTVYKYIYRSSKYILFYQKRFTHDTLKCNMKKRIIIHSTFIFNKICMHLVYQSHHKIRCTSFSKKLFKDNNDNDMMMIMCLFIAYLPLRPLGTINFYFPGIKCWSCIRWIDKYGLFFIICRWKIVLWFYVDNVTPYSGMFRLKCFSLCVYTYVRSLHSKNIPTNVLSIK